MGEFFVELAGTPEGENLALILALVSAFAHAVFAALNKQGVDPYLNRGAINLAYSFMAAPFALFVFPLPEGFLIPVLAASFVFHVGYEWLQSAAFYRGAFTLVYPIARGTGPIAIALLAIFIFDETLTLSQWGGMLLLSGAIISLAGINIREKQIDAKLKAALLPSIILAVGAGICVALYTTVDAYGIRITADPFTFLAWFFFLGGFGFPFIAYRRYLAMPEKPSIRPLVIRGFIGASVAFFSFATLMLATRIGKVSEAAALRETSIIFATAIGVTFFKERISHGKIFAIALIAIGAVTIEYGGQVAPGKQVKCNDLNDRVLNSLNSNQEAISEQNKGTMMQKLIEQIEQCKDQFQLNELLETIRKATGDDTSIILQINKK